MERQEKRRQKKRKREAKAAQCTGPGRPEAETRPPELDDVYSIGMSLGRGAYSTVSRCTHVHEGAERALKSVDRKKSPSEVQVKEEVEIMRILSRGQHPNIVKLCDVFEDTHRVYIVMELCAGGELYRYLSTLGGKGLSELLASKALAEIAGAVRYMHSLNIAHRDVKPENFMLAEARDLGETHLKAIDFGLSRRFVSGQPMTTLACTAQYVAPEVLEGRYTEMCDLWSLGVVLYVLLCGQSPFSGGTEAEVLNRVRKGKYDFAAQTWDNVGEAAKGLIGRLLSRDTHKRPSAEEVLRHSWTRRSGCAQAVAVAIS